MKPTEKRSRVGITVGALLAAGPIWGLLITAYGMHRSFGQLGNNGIGDQRALAHDVALTLSGTAIGLAVCPFGLAVLVLSVVLRNRTRRDTPPPLPVIPRP